MNNKKLYSICFLCMMTASFIVQSCKNDKPQYRNARIEKDYIIKGSCGDDVTYKLYKDGTLEISGNGPMANYDYSVEKGINDTPWAKYNDNITSLKIEGVSTIGSRAFGDLDNVKEITVPSSVKSICRGAFCGMLNLETITFQGDLDYIGEFALASCNSLYSIKFEGKVKTLDGACFQNNKSLQELDIPIGVSVLPGNMCSFCENLKTIKIPNTVKRIEIAFAYCTQLEKVNLPSSLEYIDMATFVNNVNLKEIVIPQNVSRINNLGISHRENKKIVILCNNMPSIECYWDICGEYVQGTKFEIYVPANLLSDYKRHEDLEKISDHIHSIGGEYTSMGTYYDGTIGCSYEENFNESNSTNIVANRYECRACRNTGDCPLCEGKRQTYTKRVYNYNLGCYDLDYEICRHCHGDGKCPACKGDGWLDEGIDY